MMGSRPKGSLGGRLNLSAKCPYISIDHWDWQTSVSVAFHVSSFPRAETKDVLNQDANLSSLVQVTHSSFAFVHENTYSPIVSYNAIMSWRDKILTSHMMEGPKLRILAMFGHNSRTRLLPHGLGRCHFWKNHPVELVTLWRTLGIQASFWKWISKWAS